MDGLRNADDGPLVGDTNPNLQKQYPQWASRPIQVETAGGTSCFPFSCESNAAGQWGGMQVSECGWPEGDS